jgi:hypothetical protein
MLHGIEMDGGAKRAWHGIQLSGTEAGILPDAASRALLISLDSQPFMV